jgi:hypothetical protein
MFGSILSDNVHVGIKSRLDNSVRVWNGFGMIILAILAAAASAPLAPVDAWMACLGEQGRAFADTSEPTDTAATAVMGLCKDQEFAFLSRQPTTFDGKWAVSEARDMVVTRIANRRAAFAAATSQSPR